MTCPHGSAAYFGIRRVRRVRPNGSIADSSTETGEHTRLFDWRGLAYFGISPASGCAARRQCVGWLPRVVASRG